MVSLSSPSPPLSVAGDLQGTRFSNPSNDAIMRFLSSKAGPCSAKGLLVGTLIVGDSIIPLHAAPISGQGEEISLSLDLKNAASLSLVVDGTPCVADSACFGDTYQSTPVIISDGSLDRDYEVEAPTLFRRGKKSRTAAGVALLAGSLIASTAVIRKETHMHVLPHSIRVALGMTDDPSSIQADPIVWKVTQKELDEIARKQQAQAKSSGDDGSANKREQDDSPSLIKRSLQEKDSAMAVEASPLLKTPSQPVLSTARHCHGQGRSRFAELVVGSLAVAGLVSCSAAAAPGDMQMPFGYDQTVPSTTTFAAEPVVVPEPSFQAWQQSPVRLLWSNEEVTPSSNTPIFFVAASPTQAGHAFLPGFEADPFKRPGSRRGGRTITRTFMQEVSDGDGHLPAWSAQEVAMSKRGNAPPAKGIKGSTVAKSAALAGVAGFITRSWLFPPSAEAAYEKRSAFDSFGGGDADMVKREPGMISTPKAVAAVGGAGLLGWLAQVNGHEAPGAAPKQQLPAGMAMVQRRATPSAGTYAEEETSMVRRCHGDDCHREKVTVTESKNGEQITFYTDSGRQIVYDQHPGRVKYTKDDIQRDYNTVHHNIHESLRHRLAKILHLESDDRRGVQSNSASSMLRAPGMIQWQVLLVTLLSFALFATSTGAAEVSSQPRLVKRSPLPFLPGLMQAGPSVLSTAGPSFGGSSGSYLAGAASSTGQIQGVEGLWQKQVQHNPGPLSDAQMKTFGINPKTGKEYAEEAGECRMDSPCYISSLTLALTSLLAEASRQKKAKKTSRKLLQPTPEAEKNLGANSARFNGVGPQKSLTFSEGPPMPAPAPGKLDKESVKQLAAAPGKYVGNGMGIGPDRTILDAPAAAPVPGKHRAATPGRLNNGFGGLGPDTTIIYAPGTALPPGANGKLNPFPGGGMGIGPEVYPPVKPGKNDVAPAKSPAASTKKSSSSSHHDAEFVRKAAIGGAIGGVALTSAGSVYAYNKYRKGRGKVDVEEPAVFTVATDSDKLAHQHEKGHNHHEAGPSHHTTVAKSTPHHKRDLSRVLLFEESTPASTFHLNCWGQDCNAEVKTSKQLLWQPQTEWPSAGRSSALQNPYTDSEAALMKRSPVYGLAAQSYTEVAAPLSSLSTAHAPSLAGVQWHTAPNYVTRHDVPKVTEKPKLPKPIGLQSFGSFTIPEVQDAIQGDRSRQGPSSRMGGRRAGPAASSGKHAKTASKSSESRRRLLSSTDQADLPLASSHQDYHRAKSGPVSTISQPPSHQNHRHLVQQADVTLNPSQRVHAQFHDSPSPSPMVQPVDGLSSWMSSYAKGMLGVFGVFGTAVACGTAVECARQHQEEKEKEVREFHSHGQEVQMASGRQHAGHLPQSRPLPVKRGLSTSVNTDGADLNIAGGRSLFRRHVDALDSRELAE